jgi:choline kinase/phosphatidylglycerophosphate synthase
MGVVLAAGRSERLKAVTRGGSKALVQLGGLTLIERAVRGLLNIGVEKVLVVVGCHAGPVGAVVNRLKPGRVHSVLAGEWGLGNGASLAAVEEFLRDQDLLVQAGEPAVLVDSDPSPEAWGEGCRVRIQGHVAVALGKHINEPAIDCGAFLLSAEVFEAQRQAAAEEDHTLAGAVSRLAAARGLRAVLMPNGAWWQDIDTPGDLRLARSQLRRSLTGPGDGPVSRYLNRPISTRISMALAPLHISPDLISVAAAGLALLGGGLLAMGQGILAAIFVHAASVLDGVDGETARLHMRAGPRGALLDGILDRVGDAAVMAGLGVWALGAGGTFSPAVVLSLSVAATGGSLLSMASKDRAAALGLPPAPEYQLGYLLGGRDGRLLIVAVGSVLGLPVETLIAVAATSAVTLALRLWAIRRSAQRPDTDL